jgi:hypothetical protein
MISSPICNTALNQFCHSMFQIHFHKGNNESIYEYLPKNCLPQDFGGELPTVAELDGMCSSAITSPNSFFNTSFHFQASQCCVKIRFPRFLY